MERNLFEYTQQEKEFISSNHSFDIGVFFHVSLAVWRMCPVLNQG